MPIDKGNRKVKIQTEEGEDLYEIIISYNEATLIKQILELMYHYTEG